MQAGSTIGKSRSSQTPCLDTTKSNRTSSDGVWDLLRTQSLPSASQEWLDALVGSETIGIEFGNAAAEYALKVGNHVQNIVQSVKTIKDLT